MVPPTISIHALLAESDNVRITHNPGPGYFYPRSPCGERLRTTSLDEVILYFYPRSPCGERRRGGVACYLDNIISIHALLAESDEILLPCLAINRTFLSTLSLRRATSERVPLAESTAISIHALLAESDLRVLDGSKSSIISIHALLAESD